MCSTCPGGRGHGLRKIARSWPIRNEISSRAVGGAQGNRTDFERSADFLGDVWQHNGSASEMHVGDLSWGVFHRSPPALGSLRLWSVGTESPQALTMYDGNGVCDLVVRPGDAGLRSAELALDWAEARCREASPEADSVDFRVGRRVHQQPLRRLLGERGVCPLVDGLPGHASHDRGR